MKVLKKPCFQTKLADFRMCKTCAMPRFPMDWSSRDTPWGRSQAWGTPPTRVKGPGTHPVTQGHAGPSVPASWTNLVYKFGDFQGNKPRSIQDKKRLNSRNFHSLPIIFIYRVKNIRSICKKNIIIEFERRLFFTLQRNEL